MEKNLQKHTNFRSWKSGKSWVYASTILATLAGGTAVGQAAVSADTTSATTAAYMQVAQVQVTAQSAAVSSAAPVAATSIAAAVTNINSALATSETPASSVVSKTQAAATISLASVTAVPTTSLASATTPSSTVSVSAAAVPALPSDFVKLTTAEKVAYIQSQIAAKAAAAGVSSSAASASPAQLGSISASLTALQSSIAAQISSGSTPQQVASFLQTQIGAVLGSFTTALGSLATSVAATSATAGNASQVASDASYAQAALGAFTFLSNAVQQPAVGSLIAGVVTGVKAAVATASGAATIAAINNAAKTDPSAALNSLFALFGGSNTSAATSLLSGPASLSPATKTLPSITLATSTTNTGLSATGTPSPNSVFSSALSMLYGLVSGGFSGIDSIAKGIGDAVTFGSATQGTTTVGSFNNVSFGNGLVGTDPTTGNPLTGATDGTGKGVNAFMNAMKGVVAGTVTGYTVGNIVGTISSLGANLLLTLPVIITFTALSIIPIAGWVGAAAVSAITPAAAAGSYALTGLISGIIGAYITISETNEQYTPDQFFNNTTKAYMTVDAVKAAEAGLSGAALSSYAATIVPLAAVTNANGAVTDANGNTLYHTGYTSGVAGTAYTALALTAIISVPILGVFIGGIPYEVVAGIAGLLNGVVGTIGTVDALVNVLEYVVNTVALPIYAWVDSLITVIPAVLIAGAVGAGIGSFLPLPLPTISQIVGESGLANGLGTLLSTSNTVNEQNLITTTDVSVTKGGTFSPLSAFVGAVDSTGAAVPGTAIKFIGKVNTRVAGTYAVQYQFTDPKTATVYKNSAVVTVA